MIILAQGKQMKTCSFDTCTNKHDSHGFCANHARQYKKYGHPLSKEEVHKIRSEAKIGTTHPGAVWSDEKRKARSEAWKGHQLNTGRTHFSKSDARLLGNKNAAGNIAWNKGLYTADPTNKNERLRFRKVRRLVLARDSDICQLCSCVSNQPQVDHIKSWADYPELRFKLSNLRTLCMPCHYYVTYKRKLPKGAFWGHRSTT